MPITAEASLIDVCFAVCTTLDRSGTIAVLSGGSAATFYAPQAYQSRDADFVITMYGSKSAVVMANLGYTQSGGVYSHAINPFTVEFPKGPLSVGDEIISVWETFHRSDELLHILTRIDCIKDRLLWFYHYADRSALTAAVGVAQADKVDLHVLRTWSAREGKGKEFEEFHSRL